MEINYSAVTMGWRHRMFIRPSLQLAHYVLGCEIRYLHERFRRAGQSGDMMVDIESIYADLCEYLGDERVRPNLPREPEVHGEQVHHFEQEHHFEGEEEEPVNDPPDERALVRDVLNGRMIDTTITESEQDERDDRAYGGRMVDNNADGSDDEMDVEETEEQRHRRYMDADQGEVSDPDEWADRQYGTIPSDERSNYSRLISARSALRNRYNAAAIHGNWEEAAAISRAIAEVENLMDVA